MKALPQEPPRSPPQQPAHPSAVLAGPLRAPDAAPRSSADSPGLCRGPPAAARCPRSGVPGTCHQPREQTGPRPASGLPSAYVRGLIWAEFSLHVGDAGLVSPSSHVARRTPHATRRTAHVTRRTSHVTSHGTRHTPHVTSHVTRHTCVASVLPLVLPPTSERVDFGEAVNRWFFGGGGQGGLRYHRARVPPSVPPRWAPPPSAPTPCGVLLSDSRHLNRTQENGLAMLLQ